jgi:hypothetical protein
MRELPALMPDVDAFLALTPEELAAKMLFLMRERGRADYHRDSLQDELWGSIGASAPSYPKNRHIEVFLAFAEAWAWLEAQGLLVPAEGTNGANGFRHLSRRARQFASEADFADYRIARLIPREILNTRIADPVWRALMRGEYDVAVFLAMKAVEVAVREASGLGAACSRQSAVETPVRPDVSCYALATGVLGCSSRSLCTKARYGAANGLPRTLVYTASSMLRLSTFATRPEAIGSLRYSALLSKLANGGHGGSRRPLGLPVFAKLTQ